MRIGSLRVRIVASIAALLAIFAAVSALAVFSLINIDRQIATIDQTWLTGTQLLGDLKNAVSEFRVADAQRFLAADPAEVIEAEYMADEQASAVTDLLKRFEHLSLEAGMRGDLQRFKEAWANLLAHHRVWIERAGGEQMSQSMSYDGSLQKLYETTQDAANRLISDAKLASGTEVRAADVAAGRVTMAVTALSGAAGLLAVGLLFYAERHVARPLGAITSALVRLAEGDRTIRVPELHRRDEIGAMAVAFEVFRRNAVALGEAQERAEALARHDALTGLANRRLFSTRLVAAHATAMRGLSTAVMLVDLDRFKPVNDLHGHAVGDLVLCEVAARLRGLTSMGTLVARLGGDEFAIILEPAHDRPEALEDIAALADRIVGRLTEPMAIEDVNVAVGASLGIAMMPRDGDTPEAILRAADLALYRAKQDGRGTFRFFAPDMDADLRAKAELEADLRAALAAGDIQPFYQPVVEIASGRIVGYEVLARWPHPRLGFVPPDSFVPILEQLGLLTRMTETMLRRALEDARAWEAGATLAINVSPRQLQDLSFPAIIANTLMEAGFAPHRLEVEVAETALLDHFDAARASLRALRALGVRVVLDDFGTGYAGLAHLREQIFDKIKIDRSFVAALARNESSSTIIDVVLGIARDLGMTVVAEGIETAEIAELLGQRRCALGQGYLFSPAVPAAEIAALTGTLRHKAG